MARTHRIDHQKRLAWLVGARDTADAVPDLLTLAFARCGHPRCYSKRTVVHRPDLMLMRSHRQ